MAKYRHTFFRGVTGNTAVFGTEESPFDPGRKSKVTADTDNHQRGDPQTKGLPTHPNKENSMTNQERAAEVLRDDKHYKMGPHGEQFLTSEAIRSLADAGLLMPDFPEPTKELYADIWEWRPHEDGRAVAWTAPGGRVMVQNLEPGDMTPQDARALSAALLAAANYAEKSEGNA